MSKEGGWARRVCTKRRPRGRGRRQGIAQIRTQVAVASHCAPSCLLGRTLVNGKLLRKTTCPNTIACFHTLSRVVRGPARPHKTPQGSIVLPASPSMSSTACRMSSKLE